MAPIDAKELRHDLITEFQEYVKSIVYGMVETMGLPIDLVDEFISAGYLGLVEAAERFDFNAGGTFKNYAYLRIKGSIIDSIRACSDLSGKAYRYSKALKSLQDIRETLYDEQQRTKGERDSTTVLAEFMEFAAKGALAFRMSEDDAEVELANAVDPKDTPEALMQNRDERKLFKQLVAELPEKERLIIEEYYFNDRSFIEIAETHEGMSKSWVSRLHDRALKTLKEKYHERLQTSL